MAFKHTWSRGGSHTSLVGLAVRRTLKKWQMAGGERYRLDLVEPFETPPPGLIAQNRNLMPPWKRSGAPMLTTPVAGSLPMA
jgi:hypothetical protein